MANLPTITTINAGDPRDIEPIMNNFNSLRNKFDGGVDGTNLSAGAVLEANIGTGAVTEGKIGTDAVTRAKIATGAVGNDELASDAVTQAKVADNAIGTAEIIDLNVTTGKLADDAVTISKMANAGAAGSILRHVASATASGVGAGSSVTMLQMSSDITDATNSYLKVSGSVGSDLLTAGGSVIVHLEYSVNSGSSWSSFPNSGITENHWSFLTTTSDCGTSYIAVLQGTANTNYRFRIVCDIANQSQVGNTLYGQMLVEVYPRA